MNVFQGIGIASGAIGVAIPLFFPDWCWRINCKGMSRSHADDEFQFIWLFPMSWAIAIAAMYFTFVDAALTGLSIFNDETSIGVALVPTAIATYITCKKLGKFVVQNKHNK